MMIIQIALYLSLLILLIGVVGKAVKISRMPVHLRWDLYPIPHEKGRAAYGGSYYEELDWWTKPANFSFWGELKEMAGEIFIIKTLYRHNKAMWYFSFPFHLGLYCMVCFLGLVFIGAIMQLSGVEISPASAVFSGRAVFALTVAVGAAGWLLGIIGSVGLLLMRVISNKYRNFSLISDYFNLLLLSAIFSAGLMIWFSLDKSFYSLREFVSHLVTFRLSGEQPLLIKVELILAAIFFAYLPFTHMTHFMGKFFTYHRVRWQDKPNFAGGEIEREVISAIGERTGWSAPHAGAGRIWRDAVTNSDEAIDGSHK